MEIPKIFHEVVEPDHTRLHTPFWRDGYLYATDGRILVRRACDLADVEPYRGVVRAKEWGCPDRLVDCGFVMTPEAIAASTVSAAIPDGIVEHEVESDVEVERFSGGCKVVHWTEVSPNIKPTEVKPEAWEEGVPFASRYLAMLKRHGVNALLLHNDGHKDAVKSPGYFMGEGFDGMLMPMNPVG